MKTFIDTSAWLALRVKGDQYFSQAQSHYHDLKKHRALFFTNEHVLDEFYTRLIYDFNMQVANQAHQELIQAAAQGQLRILEIDEPDREQAWQCLLKYADLRLSYTDALIVANVEKYSLDQIFTFDKHFQAVNLVTNPFWCASKRLSENQWILKWFIIPSTKKAFGK